MKVSVIFPAVPSVQRQRSWTCMQDSAQRFSASTLCEIEDWQCCGGVFVSAKDEIASKLSERPRTRWRQERTAAFGYGMFSLP